MKLFLSYASQDRETAKAIELELLEQGHDVFFDREDLPPGEGFHTRIRHAIAQSDLLVFLVSPDAVDPGSYTLTELEIAEQTWKRASGKLLPVVLRPTPLQSLPPFLKSVTFLETAGSVPAAVAATVERKDAERKRRLFTKVGVAGVIAFVVAIGALRYWSARAPDTAIVGRDGAPALLIPSGIFTMGDNEDAPQRDIFLDAFYIDRYEVTTARYAEFLKATNSVHPPDEWESLNSSTGGQLPVVGVDWNDATAYCTRAGKRLPTDAEWEKAARGMDRRRYPWGNDAPTVEHANYGNASPLAYEGGLSDVGKHAAGASAFGIDDMAGNAAEWVADWYTDTFADNDVRNPTGPATGDKKVIRGGGRFDGADRLSVVRRFYAQPDQRSEDIGFRCARDLR
ncbi:MAG: SUMF1/EgtB/PvdO family nonheme iron enzyme [Gemmatimonadaceae bacterium]